MNTLFAHPGYLLAGLLVGAVPLLIHLFTRDRIRKVAFPTLRFFTPNSRALIARRRLYEIFLIALRVLVCVLAGLAFADYGSRKAEPAKPGTEAGATARVIVTDVSASLGREELRSGRRKALQEALARLGGDDRMQVVAAADAAGALLPDFTRDRATVEEVLTQAEPGEGGTDLEAGLRLAGQLLETVPEQNREIVLVSDLQRCGWQRYQGDWRLPPGVRLRVLPVRAEASDARGAVAVKEADIPQTLLPGTEEHALALRLHNYGRAPRKNVGVTLRIEGREQQTQTVNLPALGSAVVRFAQVFAKEGDHAGWLRIDSAAALAGADRYYFNISVLPKVRVLLVNGSPSRNPLTDAAFFLKLALEPGKDAPYQVRTINAAEVHGADFAGVSVVVLADTNGLGADGREGLRALLERGGGVFFLPAEGVRAGAFNNAFMGITPCTLRRILIPPAPQPINQMDLEHPALAVFAPARHGNFNTIEVRRYWEVADTQKARVLARFADGRPMLIENPAGKGNAILSTTPILMGWNSFPKNVLLVPFLHQLVRYLAVQSDRRTAYTVGEAIAVAQGGSLKRVEGENLGADNASGRMTAGAGGLLQRSGLYRLRDSQGQESVLAVNRSLAETDPAAVEAEELVAALQSMDGQLRRSPRKPAATAATEQPERSEVWWYVLALLCGWLLAEHLLASRTLRH